MTPVKTGKTIPFVKTDRFDTRALIQMILSYNPNNDDTNPDKGNWGLTTDEMRYRKGLRKNIESLPEDAEVIDITEEQAKHLYSLSRMIKWKFESDEITDFEDSLK